MRLFCRRSLTGAWGFKELRHAALLSLASGKNINEILRLKENNS